MKKTVRILSLVLSAVAAFCLAVPAGAADFVTEDGSAGAFGGERFFGGAVSDGESLSEYAGAVPDIGAEARSVPVLPEKGTYREGEFLVKARSGMSALEYSDPFAGIAEDYQLLFSVPGNGEEDSVSGLSYGESDSDWYLVRLSEGEDMLGAWNSLLEEDGVLTVEPNYLAYAESIDEIGACDPYAHAQDWLEAIDAPAAWETIESGGKTPGDGVVVAVVDTGIDLDHPDLSGRLWSDSGGSHGYDFVNGDNVPDDDYGHGTHVAGIIAASKNETGVVGVAYGARLMAVKVLDESGSGSDANVISGISYAIDNKADIINLSLGGYGDSEAYGEVLKKAVDAGILVAAAAGNSAQPTSYAGDTYYGVVNTPGDYPGVLTVMAMNAEADEDGNWLADFSNYDSDPGEGYEYEVMAPGVDVLSTGMGGGYQYMSGTSMACPVVSGAAAVLMGIGCTREEASNIIANSGELKRGRQQPDGTVRYYRALDLVSALEAESAGTAYDPVIANCEISAQCASVTVNGTSVSLGSLNTTSRVYFQNSSFLSKIKLSLENLGAASGNITVKGTVGTAAVNTVIGPVAAGKILTVELPVTGMPAKAASVTVSLTLTPKDAGGTALSPINVNRTFDAYDFTLPSDITYSSAQGKYILSSSSVTVGSSDEETIRPILCLPADLYIASGQMLIFQYGIIYEKSGVKIEVADGGNAIFGAASLIGGGAFIFMFDGAGSGDLTPRFDEYADFYSCSVKDPYIMNARYVDTVEFYSGGGSLPLSPAVKAYAVTTSGFYYFDRITVHSTYFFYNLMNACTGSALYGGALADNTFVDNGDYLSDGSVGNLCVYTSDYSASTGAGFYENCVVGPISVYRTSGGLAVVSDVYYQPVNATVTFGDGTSDTVLPAGTSDTISCAAGSDFYTDIEKMYDSGYNWVCPAFESLSYLAKYATDGDSISYTLGRIFSAPVCYGDGYPLYCYSPTDPFMDGRDVSGDTVFSSSSMTCEVSGSTALLDYEATHYYELSGYCTQTYTFNSGSKNYYWATSMGRQTMYRFPAELDFYSTRLDVAVACEGGKPVLTWSGEKYEDGFHAEVFRSTDGGEEQQLANVGAALSYTDTGAVPGSLYTYTVRVYDAGGEQYMRGNVDFALSGTDAGLTMEAENNSQISSALTVGTDAPAWFGLMELDIAYDEETFDIGSLSFSDEVKASGLAYGAIKTGDGTATVLIGQSGGAPAALPAGPLLSMAVSNADETASSAGIAVAEIRIDGADAGWETAGCSFTIRAGSSKLARSEDGASIAMWRETGDIDSVFAAKYGSDGRMLGICVPKKGCDNDLGQFLSSGASEAAVFYTDSGAKPLCGSVKIALSAGAE